MAPLPSPSRPARACALICLAAALGLAGEAVAQGAVVTMPLPAAPDRPLGDAALCARYHRALALFGRSAQTAGEGMAAAGLWQIAARAGLC